MNQLKKTNPILVGFVLSITIWIVGHVVYGENPFDRGGYTDPFAIAAAVAIIGPLGFWFAMLIIRMFRQK